MPWKTGQIVKTVYNSPKGSMKSRAIQNLFFDSIDTPP